MNDVGVVIIGRNEGDRLRRCLESVDGHGAVVYVDSNSSDSSVSLARQMGVQVVELDMSVPFSAARARNEGFAKLRQCSPHLPFVQFADGDCELVDGWMELAAGELHADPTLAAVAGRRRERYPDATLYNRLCDIEWNTPVGDAKACGGDAMMRADVFEKLGGFDASVIAGEEPELCVRMRAAGHKIRRIDAEMTLHDAAMTRFSQWWQRMKRSGHAYAQGAEMHGGPPEKHWTREVRSILVWGLLVPLTALALAWPTQGWSLILFLGYGFPVFRARRYYRTRGFSVKDASLAAAFDVLAKFPQLGGLIKFYHNRFFAKQSSLIEYKGATT